MNTCLKYLSNGLKVFFVKHIGGARQIVDKSAVAVWCLLLGLRKIEVDFN